MKFAAALCAALVVASFTDSTGVGGPVPVGPTDRQAAVHLLERATFDPRPEDILQIAQRWLQPFPHARGPTPRRRMRDGRSETRSHRRP